MHMLGKDTAKKVSSILASPYYKEWVHYYEKVLRATRSKRHKYNKKGMLAIQYGIAKTETLLWEKLREGRLLAKDLHDKSTLTDKEKKDLQGAEEHIFIHEQLIRISRTICDGIAWRNIKYNRTFFSSSARGFAAGDININNKDFKSEFLWAHRITEQLDAIVILNDLTRFLRMGDLTEIHDDAVFIHEIKEYGKDIKNMFTLKDLKKKMKLSNQAKRLLELQRIALFNEVRINDLLVKTKKFNTNLKTYIKTIEKMLMESKSKYIVTKDFDSCITVEVTNYETIIKDSAKVSLDQLRSLTKPSNIKEFILVHSNWDTFYSDQVGNFLREVPPYSIFPFSNPNCIKLMSGFYLVQVKLNIDKLKVILREKGWEIEEISEEDLDKQIAEFERVKDKIFSVKGSIYENTPDEKGLFIIKRGPFSLAFTSMIYTRITMEYMTLETFLAILEEMYSVAAMRQKDDIYFPDFNNDKDLWN